MQEGKIPTIFSARRRARRLMRAAARHNAAAPAPAPADYILEDITEDMRERLAFVRHQPQRAAVLGDVRAALVSALAAQGAAVTIGDADWLDAPWPTGGFDLIAVVGLLDAVNDLPGALIHIRNALAPGGLAIASFIGGASLGNLRAAMLAAEPNRPAARMHPLVDPRAAPQLLQRAGWKDPVVDSHSLQVRFSSLGVLVNDLRDQGLGSALADAAAPLGKSALLRAQARFAALADAGGKTPETFEIITLTGRRSLAGT
jgi:SAM-dependent methyltransferase